VSSWPTRLNRGASKNAPSLGLVLLLVSKATLINEWVHFPEGTHAQ
jgi:hypothetical protein